MRQDGERTLASEPLLNRDLKTARCAIDDERTVDDAVETRGERVGLARESLHGFGDEVQPAARQKGRAVNPIRKHHAADNVVAASEQVVALR